jgi:hypothetical protein
MVAPNGTDRQSEVESDILRGKAAALFAEGMTNGEVAAELGITERRARAYKTDVRDVLRAAANAPLDGLIDGAGEARRVFHERAHSLAQIIVCAAAGVLPVGGPDVPPGVYEQEPDMIRARVQAACAGLKFIVGQKVDLTVDVPDEKLNRLAAMLTATGE